MEKNNNNDIDKVLHLYEIWARAGLIQDYSDSIETDQWIEKAVGCVRNLHNLLDPQTEIYCGDIVALRFEGENCTKRFRLIPVKWILGLDKIKSKELKKYFKDDAGIDFSETEWCINLYSNLGANLVGNHVGERIYFTTKDGKASYADIVANKRTANSEELDNKMIAVEVEELEREIRNGKQ